jgi:UDP-glucose 4-epimerase
MKRVLITGGAGFIAYHLARHLSEHAYEIDLLDNFSRGVKDDDLQALVSRPGLRLIDGDLLDPRVFESCDGSYELIFHLAARVGVGHVLRSPYRVLADNVAMQLNLLSWLPSQTKLKRVLFASTSEVYAGTLERYGLTFPTPEGTALTLSDLSQPRTSYALSKIYGEALMHQSGLPFTILRPHNIYGPRMGMSHVIPELLHKVYRALPDTPLKVFSINHRRTFCFVDDAVTMIRMIAESDKCQGQTVNIGTSSPEVTMGELAELILKVVGKSLRIDPQPATAGSPERRCPDTSFIRSLVSPEATISLEDGIRRTFAWYKRNAFEREGVSAL